MLLTAADQKLLADALHRYKTDERYRQGYKYARTVARHKRSHEQRKLLARIRDLSLPRFIR